MTPILGFTPDVDPTTAGAILDCDNMIPTTKGMKAAPSGVSAGIDALSGACIGASLVYKIDGTSRIIAGTQSGLYEVTGGTTWTDRSRAAPYTTGTDERWRFAQLGDATIATNGLDVLQASTSGAFADIATAPKAKAIDVVSGFVMALGYNDGVNNFPDGWFSSGLFDYTNWTPSASSQSANGRLLDTNGEIRGGRKLGQTMVVYKENSMYLGVYQGPPVIWSWQLISNSIGAYSHESIIPVENAHLFVGPTGFYVFDGTRPQPIGDAEVREWFFSHLNKTYGYKIQGGYDRERKLAYWYYPSTNSTGTCDAGIVYHLPTGKWGRITRTIESLIDHASPGLTYDGLGALYSTFNDLPSSTGYDNPAWAGGIQQAGYFDTTHTVQLAQGTATTSSLTTWDGGDDNSLNTITKVRPRFLVTPASGNITHYYKNSLGDPLGTGPTATLLDGKFDVLWSSRWHRVKMDFSGDCEVLAVEMSLEADGLF